MKNWSSASSLVAIFSYAALLIVTFIIPPSVSSAGNPPSPLNVHVTLRGKNYDISNVSTVRELQKNVEDQSGLLPSKQSVLFGGQKLKPSDVLSDVGVEEGSVINIVPLSSSSNKKKKSSKSSSSLSSPTGTSSSSSSGTGDGSSTGEGGSSSTGNMMEELMKQAGLDATKLDDMMKAMGGGAAGGGGTGGMPDMKQSMEMMQEMMNSPLFQEYFNDPEKLEQSRQMILQNPMMKGMMANLPGFDDILNDEAKWRETMMAASQMYKEMGSMMGGGAAGAGMFGDGLEGLGAAKDTLNAALDELSEGEL